MAVDATWTALRGVAARHPDRDCLEDAAGVVTLGQLAGRSGEIAEALRAGGVADGIVAVLLERDRDLPAAFFAVHQAGATYLPLSPVHPGARLATVVEDAGPRCVITSSALARRLPERVPKLLLDDMSWQGEAPSPAESGVPDSAYVLYTSGSTGQPKGVLIAHDSLAGFFTALDNDFSEPADQVWLAHASAGYDASLPELIWALSRGHYVCLTGSDPLSIMTSQLATGTRHGRRVSHLLVTPSLLRLLIEHDTASAGLRELHTLLVGGEPFPVDLVTRLLDPGSTAGRSPRIRNLYGPTEATVWVAGAPCTAPGDAATRISVTTPDTRVRILDDQLREVAEGGTGRLFIGGRQVALGYLHREELTRERFVADPLGAPGDRLFDTGDLARREADGAFVVTGRSDDQIKIAGHRVELGEIEAVVRTHPEVTDALCVPDSAPVATSLTVLVTSSSTALDTVELRRWLKQRLPPHMVATRIESRAELPLTPSGKTSRGRAAPAGTRDAEDPVAQDTAADADGQTKGRA
ncbi:amino acid adenylation domain-containing protein [Streptomyces sp. NBC_00696]|uniref:amino acid adenylation domain-containing protein n=1 Tax=Streptomyces sp. NBC_00696 TaxID=2903672 RepID=UPI002E329D48|nr:amino acid adenylation domain-containing protein [Streptomyces sp. NBC_00696]